jgi:small subunit ribosomal protein S21
MQVLVRDNNIEQAMRVLKKKMQREGIFRELRQRKAYEKPSEKKTREKAEAIRRNPVVVQVHAAQVRGRRLLPCRQRLRRNSAILHREAQRPRTLPAKLVTRATTCPSRPANP